jgi:zinc protease
MGDFEYAQAMELASELFANWKGSENAPWSLEPIPDIKKNQILLVNKPEATQAQIRIASKGPDRLYSQLIAARLSSLILGGGLTSRLMEAIRVNRGLTYGIGSILFENEVGGIFCISSHTKSATVGELIEVALEEAQKYREQGPTEEEIQRSKTYVNGLFPLSLESMERLARAFAEIKLFTRPADWLEKYRERVLEVSAFQATKEAQQFFLPSNWALAVVGNARAIEKQLHKWGEVEIVGVGN